MYSYKNDDDMDDEEECSIRPESTVEDIDQAFTRLGKDIVSVFLPSNNILAWQSHLTCLLQLQEPM